MPVESRSWRSSATTATFEPTSEILLDGKAKPDRVILRGKDKVTIGKDSSCDVCVPGWRVARTQSRILAKGTEYYLMHLSGSKHTTVNGQKIQGKHKLRRGDIIGIGGTKLRFE